MGDLTRLKLDEETNLIPFFQELPGFLEGDLQVVSCRTGLNLYTLNVLGLALEAVLLLPFLLVIFILAVVYYAANGGLGVGSYEDQVQAGVLGHLEGFSGLNDAYLLTCGSYQSYVRKSKTLGVYHWTRLRPDVSSQSSYVVSPLVFILGICGCLRYFGAFSTRRVYSTPARTVKQTLHRRTKVLRPFGLGRAFGCGLSRVFVNIT